MRKFFLICVLIASAASASAQRLALKNNLLYDATLTPNLSFEIGLGRKTTLDLMAGYNPWNRNGSWNDNKKLVHLLIEPEFRYWLCNRFSGHFFGVHGVFAHYNIGGYNISLLDFEKEYRYNGYAYGAGISYGYHWMWSKRWGMEFTVGAGVVYFNYDKYDCPKCGEKIGKDSKLYFGPTKLGVSLVFMIN